MWKMKNTYCGSWKIYLMWNSEEKGNVEKKEQRNMEHGETTWCGASKNVMLKREEQRNVEHGRTTKFWTSKNVIWKREEKRNVEHQRT